MADYYMSFSARFNGPPEAIEELEKRLAASRDNDGDDNDDLRCYGIDWQRQKDAHGEFLWLHGEGGPNLEGLVHIVEELQLDMDLEHAFAFEWANTASKPLLDGFGGGAVLVHKGESQWFNTGRWLDERMKELP